MDSSLPVSIARHFVKQYSLINSNLKYIEMPRTGHTPLSKRLFYLKQYHK